MAGSTQLRSPARQSTAKGCPIIHWCWPAWTVVRSLLHGRSIGFDYGYWNPAIDQIDDGYCETLYRRSSLAYRPQQDIRSDRQNQSFLHLCTSRHRQGPRKKTSPPAITAPRS
ncbi:hypothetical protein JG687_00013242 [Phytophthora cactorum]|uniref:Uncharacterized protein n=1 Tax=Phytophthora cactorum TaxID=29920 RepID=A0A8T1U479_9STRA|nr:hypothetical protein JG687_00013242 [Phytophthora cactorum]